MPWICQSHLFPSALALKAILKRGYSVTQVISKGYWPKIYCSICVIRMIFVTINQEAEQVTSPSERNKSIHLGYKTAHNWSWLLLSLRATKVLTLPSALSHWFWPELDVSNPLFWIFCTDWETKNKIHSLYTTNQWYDAIMLPLKEGTEYMK